MELEKIMNSQLKLISPYVAGKTIDEVAGKYQLKKKDIIKLASNENVLGPSPKALKAVQNQLKNIHIYPDSAAGALTEKVARWCGVKPSQILFGNGSNEILEFICRAFLKKGDEVIVSENTFSLYETFSKIAGAKVVRIPLKKYSFDLQGALKKITRKTKIIFLCNPNNPTGTLVPDSKLKEFIQAIQQRVLLVLDEAYGDFREDEGMNRSCRFLNRKNVILLRTFSKIFGLAALRIGYGLGHPDMISILKRVRQPFNVNLLAQAAAFAGLEDRTHQKKSKRLIWNEKNYLYKELKKTGCLALPSDANFICVKVGNSQRVAQRMIHDGILIRPLGSFGMDAFIRITIGTHLQNQRLIRSLNKALKVS